MFATERASLVAWAILWGGLSLCLARESGLGSVLPPKTATAETSDVRSAIRPADARVRESCERHRELIRFHGGARVCSPKAVFLERPPPLFHLGFTRSDRRLCLMADNEKAMEVKRVIREEPQRDRHDLE